MGHQHDVRRLSAGAGDPEHRFVHSSRGCHRGGALGPADRVRGRAGADAAFRVALWLGRRLGDLFHLALPSRRRTALENLAIAFPERSVSERRVLCRSVFEHLGMTLVEAGLALACTPAVLARRISVDGLEHLEAATAASRPGGVLVLTAHFGNWELAGLMGPLYGVSMATVIRPLDSPLLDRLARRLRVSTGVEMIDKREAFRAVTEALRRRQLVAILLDQNASRSEGVFVPFFGRPASTSRGLALLSLRTGTPILPVFMHREPDGRHHLVIEPAIPAPPRGALSASIEELTAACASRIEATVRRWPEQWLWLHRRWRTRPVGETTRA